METLNTAYDSERMVHQVHNRINVLRPPVMALPDDDRMHSQFVDEPSDPTPDAADEAVASPHLVSARKASQADASSPEDSPSAGGVVEWMRRADGFVPELVRERLSDADRARLTAFAEAVSPPAPVDRHMMALGVSTVVGILVGIWIGTTFLPSTQQPYRGASASTSRTPPLAPIRAEAPSRRIADRLLAFTAS